MKKIITVNGKKYIVDLEDTSKGLEEVEEDEDDTGDEGGDTGDASEDGDSKDDEDEDDDEDKDGENLDEKIDDAATKIMKKLGLDDIKKDLAQIKKDKQADKKVSELINLEKLMDKKVDEMTAKEKIIGFFQAMVQNNHPVLKALSEGTAADGGYLFPDEFRAEVIRDIAETPHMRNEVTVIPMKRDIMNIPTLTSGPLVTWTEENAVKSTTTAHFGQATLTVKKMAAILYASDELIEDSDLIDVVQFIIGLFSERIAEEEDRVITAGNGTTEPTGYNQASLTSVASATGNLSFTDLIDLEFLLPAKYNRNAKFYAHRNNIKELRKLVDTTGRFLWLDNVVPGQPGTFHGFPVIEDNNLAESEIYFGDLKQAYWLGDRKKMTVKVSQDTTTAFTKDQTAIRVVARIAGNVVLTSALKKLTGIA